MEVEVLLNFGSRIDIISLVFVTKLGLRSKPTNVGVQKRDDSALETYEMIFFILLL